MKVRLVGVIAVLVLFIAGCGVQIPPQEIEALKGTIIETILGGSPAYPFTTGKAKYKVDGTEREFQVEIEAVCYYNSCGPTPLFGTVVRVYADGVLVGNMRVSALGTARLNRNTDRGQVVPNIAVGSLVEVKTRTGVLVASGRF